jgi:hypothetical protein
MKTGIAYNACLASGLSIFARVVVGAIMLPFLAMTNTIFGGPLPVAHRYGGAVLYSAGSE